MLAILDNECHPLYNTFNTLKSIFSKTSVNAMQNGEAAVPHLTKEEERIELFSMSPRSHSLQLTGYISPLSMWS